MASLNKVTLIGRLGKDPEVRYTPDNNAITNITLATSEKYKDKNTGEPKEITEWHRVVFFNRIAEIAGQYLKKGSLIYLEGRIRTRKWTDQSGQDRYTTEIVADKMEFLDTKNSSGGGVPYDDGQGYGAPQSSTSAAKPASRPTVKPMDDMEDDIPF